jgi:hypothetical protein
VRRLLPLLALVSAGCQRFPDDTPASAYRSLGSAVQRGHEDRALELLSTPSRRALSERSQTLSTDSGGSLADDPAALAFGPAHVAAPTEVTVKSQSENSAVLAVTAGGSVSEVHLVREAGHWRISIPALEHAKDG